MKERQMNPEPQAISNASDLSPLEKQALEALDSLTRNINTVKIKKPTEKQTRDAIRNMRKGIAERFEERQIKPYEGYYS
jgi:hypothetical protein